MSKRSNNWNEDKLKKFLDQGRGSGRGKEYVPWIQITDFGSKGRVTRALSWKTQRIHHLLTDSQTRYFYLLEWEDSVIDIREHFPLLNAEDIIEEKHNLNFNLFKDKESGCSYILSTTFLITIKEVDGKEKLLARSIKSSSELGKKITLEKLEIERRFWKYKGVDWGVVTNKEIPVAKSKNIEWIHSALYSYDDRGISKEKVQFLCNAFIQDMPNKHNEPIRRYTSRFDKNYNLETGTGLFIFKYLIASKTIEVDMNNEIDINSPLDIVVIVQGKEGKGVKGSC